MSAGAADGGVPGLDEPLVVEVWADVVCPWCYIGERRLEAALARFEHADAVEVVPRSFELDPHAASAPPGARPGEQQRRLAAKFGTDVEQVRAMQADLTRTAAAEGLAFDLDAQLPANTLDAHRVLHLARETGGPALARQVAERFMDAHFTRGAALGDAEVLVGLAAAAGLDAGAVREVLGGDRYSGAVRAEEDEARRLGATGVPFFVLDRRYGVAGAQSPDHLLEVLRRAWADRAQG